MKKNLSFTDFMSFVQDKGFIWGPSPEIYGGVSGFYTYGPLGKLLKNKVENQVRRLFQSNNFWELECPIVLPDIVWKASGHLDTFKDPIIECSKCKSAYRADHIIEELKGVSAASFSDQQMLNFIQENRLKCPACGSEFRYEVKDVSLMMKTKVAGQDASLRPETATVTYLPFKRYYKLFREKLPVGVFQIGKAFRNEISPRQHVIRGREFTQAEAQLFMDPKEKNRWPDFDRIKSERLPLWTYTAQKRGSKPRLTSLSDALKNRSIKTRSYAWCIWLAYKQFVDMGFKPDCIRLRQHHPDEKAFYAEDAWDIELKLKSFGWTEVCGIHDRTDYDLLRHSEFSKEQLTATREDGTRITPHVLEIAFGTDRPVLALLDMFYEKKGKEEGKTLFNIPYHLAPVDIAVFPLLKKPELEKIGEQVKAMLDKDFVVVYDVSGSIGRRYLRSTEIGIPYCITVDFDSIKNKDVTIRDRNTARQIRVRITELKDLLKRLLDGSLDFKSAGKPV